MKTKLFKRTLASLAVCTAIGVGACGINRYLTSPEYVRARALAYEIKEILPSKGESLTYSLDEGREVTVVHYASRYGSRLEIVLDDVAFTSEKWHSFWREGNALVLREIRKKVGDRWILYSKAMIEDSDVWQKKYEELIELIARKKSESDEKAH